jgi:hypothetical protein
VEPTLSRRFSSDLAFVRDGRDLLSALRVIASVFGVFGVDVLCSVPVLRPVFSPRSARFAYICAVLRSSPVIRPNNSSSEHLIGGSVVHRHFRQFIHNAVLLHHILYEFFRRLKWQQRVKPLSNFRRRTCRNCSTR